MRRDIERLEKELIQSSRTIAEYEENMRMLNNRVQFVEKEKKKMLEEQTHSYSEKLKIYVEEIANIKNLLDENEFETGNLKMENEHLIEENDLLRYNLEELGDKLNIIIEAKDGIEK